MKNLFIRSTKNSQIKTSTYWLIITVSLFLVPVKRIYSQVPGGSSRMMFMESVWLSTDRSIYLPGEQIEFSAIVLETDTYSPSRLSNILKVELIDNKGNRLAQRHFYLENSRVNQVLSIPSSLPGNWYYLRAYTNWMRNSPDAMNNFLPIKIISPDDLSKGESKNNHKDLIASVFPENENLVADRMNHCAVRIRSGDGVNIETTAMLVSSSNDTVARFITDKTGWGEFSFTPSISSDYNVVIPGSQEPEIETRIDPPETDSPYAKFFVEDDSIKLSVSNVKTDRVKLLIHRNYSCFGYFTADVNDGNVSFSILTRSLPDGLMQFTLLTPDHNVLFKRLFISNDLIGSPPEISMERSELNPGVIYTEIKGETTISTGNQLVNVMVSREQPGDLSDLYIPGIPGWHFTYDIPATTHGLVGWLIANNYPDEVVRSFFSFDGPVNVSWTEYLIAERENLYEFLPETRGLILTGKVIDGEGIPLPNQVIAATLLSDNNFYAANTFPSGRFHMVFPDRTGLEDLVVCFTSKPPSDWDLLIDPQFDTTRLTIPVRSYTITGQEAEYIRDLDVNRQLTSVYKKDERNIIEEQIKPAEQVPFYGKAEKVTLVDNYIKLTNIREVIYEVVPGVTVRKRDGRYRLGIFGDPPLPSNYNPLFLLDGIPMIDFDDFLELPSDRLREIRQLNKLYIHGNAVFSGIVDFASVNNDMAGIGLPDKSQLLSISMPLRNVTRNIPEKVITEGNIPVLGNTLFWESFIDRDLESFSFKANNNPGIYVNRIAGFNAKGQWIHGKKTIFLGLDIPNP